MAVEDYFANNASNVGEKTEPGSNAQEIVRYVGHATIAVADDDGSTYLLCKDLPSSFRPVKATIFTDAITTGTDYNVGLNNAETGAVVDDNLFVDAQDLSSASKVLDGLSNVGIEKIGALQTIAELLGLTPTTAKSRYDVVLTGITVGSAAGDVIYILEGFAA